MNAAILSGKLNGFAKYKTLGDCGCGCGGSCGGDHVHGLAGDAPPVINWNTEPDTSADGRKIKWSCNDWITWHQKVAAKYGVKRANEVFVQWWDKAVPWYDLRAGSCEFNCAFQNYFSKAGSWNTSWLAKASCKGTETVNEVVDSAGNIIQDTAKAGENAAKAAGNASKVLKILLPVAVVAIVGGAGYYVYKHYMKGNRKVKVGTATV